MAPVGGWAENVRNSRKPASSDNLFTAIQEDVSQKIVASLDAWRQFSEAAAERAFMAAFGSETVQTAAGVDPRVALPPRRAGKNLLQHELIEKRIGDLRSRMSSGGLREAVIRSLLFAGLDRAAVDERGFEALRRIRQSLSDLPLSAFKATVREQFDMLSIDTEGAVAAIPSMLPADIAARQKAFKLICEVLSARGRQSSEDLNRIRRIGSLYGIDGQLSSSENLAIAPSLRNEPKAKASRAARRTTGEN